MNHYDMLEVSPKASPEVIRAAYKSLMQRFHPDRNPGDRFAAERTSHIAIAYGVLSDAARRADYDASLSRIHEKVSVPHQDLRSKPETFSTGPSIKRTLPPARHMAGDNRSARWKGLFMVLAACLAAGIWLASSHTKTVEPVSELAMIRRSITSEATPESEKSDLYARKQEILSFHPGLQLAESAARSEDMAWRTVSLLRTPLVVEINGHNNPGKPVAKLTIPRISLLVGTFDATNLVAHMEKHRQRIVDDLSAVLANTALHRLTEQGTDKRLENMIRKSVSQSLEYPEFKAYPTTYFESPGRYGVVEVLLPDNFSLQP